MRRIFLVVSVDYIFGDILDRKLLLKELRLLKMVNLVISEAVNRGYLSENRILPLILHF